MRMFKIKSHRLSLYLFLIFTLMTAYGIYWGLRDTHVGSDTITYEAIYASYLKRDANTLSSLDPGFLLIMKIASLFSNDPNSLFILICILNSAIFYLCGLVFLKKPRYLFVYTLFIITSPFYLSININIIRHGTAISAALLCLILIYRFKNGINKFILSLIPLLFHKVAGVLTFPLFFQFTRLNLTFLWILLASISYFSNYYSELASILIPADFLDYTSGNFGYIQGFRFNFVLFSLLPIVMTGMLPFKKMSHDTRWIFNSYLLMNGIGLTMNFISYSDRLLTSSWILMPLLATLFIKDINMHAYSKKDNKIFFTAAIILFMVFINTLA